MAYNSFQYPMDWAVPGTSREDPMNPKYLTVCFVCEEEAKPGQEHLKNYGGIVCYSCRAFWRRSHQKNRDPEFVCKKGGTCKITVKTRRRCQKCRYQRCLEAGMRPDSVLNEDQKKIRFRKLLLKKQKEAEAAMAAEAAQAATATQAVTGTEVAASFLPMNQHFVQTGQFHASLQQLTSDFTMAALGLNLPTHGGECENLCADIVDLSLAKPTTSYKSFLERRDSVIGDVNDFELQDLITQNVCNIISSYQLSQAECSCERSEQIYMKLLLLQKGDPEIRIPTEDVLFFISEVAKLLKNFAMKQRAFTELPKNDQRELLQRNGQLFVQLVFGGILFQPSEDARTSSCHASSRKKVWLKNIKHKWDIERFNAATKLFRPTADFEHFARLVRTFETFTPMNTLKERGVLAHVILFDHDKLESLENYERIFQVQKMNENFYNEHIKTSEIDVDFKTMRKVLQEMATFCKQNIVWDRSPSGPDEKNEPLDLENFLVCYTKEEMDWLNYLFKSFDDTIKSVQFGEEMIREFVAVTCNGARMQEDHPAKVLKVQLERSYRVFMMHPEFRDLPYHQQIKMLTSNTPKTVALMVLRGDTRSSALQQIQEALGETDQNVFKSKYEKLIGDTSKAQRLTMDKVPGLSSEDLALYESIVEKTRILFADADIFKLTFLLIATQSNDFEDRELTAAHGRYAILMKRRIRWLCKEKKLLGCPNEILSSYFSSLDKLSLLAPMFLQIFANHSPVINPQ